jgi:hypothetical protein
MSVTEGSEGKSLQQECRISVTDGSDGDIVVTGVPYECY